jgi:hypothetical protein
VAVSVLHESGRYANYVDISKQDFIAMLKHIGACDPAIDWVRNQREPVASAIWDKCDVYSWRTWLRSRFCGGGFDCHCNSDAWEYVMSDILRTVHGVEPLEPPEFPF